MVRIEQIHGYVLDLWNVFVLINFVRTRTRFRAIVVSAYFFQTEHRTAEVHDVAYPLL